MIAHALEQVREKSASHQHDDVTHDVDTADVIGRRSHHLRVNINIPHCNSLQVSK